MLPRADGDPFLWQGSPAPRPFLASSSGAGPWPGGCGVPTLSKQHPHLRDTFWGGTGLPRGSPSTAPGVPWAGKRSLAKVYVCGWG